jgi:hypothetical protein
MTNDCKDRDLLPIEPCIFTGGGFESQQLAAGLDGVMSGTLFSSGSADFSAAGVQAGMVLCIYSSVPAEARAYEILSVNSGTSLTVSILRSERDGPAAAPPTGSSLKYYINTFAPQISAAQSTLLEKLRRISEASGVAAASFVDSAQFLHAVALAVLSDTFTARASNAFADDANWVKAEFYRRQHVAAVSALRLATDIDGDGLAEQTRTLGNVSLRRI